MCNCSSNHNETSVSWYVFEYDSKEETNLRTRLMSIEAISIYLFQAYIYVSLTFFYISSINLQVEYKQTFKVFTRFLILLRIISIYLRENICKTRFSHSARRDVFGVGNSYSLICFWRATFWVHGKVAAKDHCAFL